jgi:hypothetical protein
LYVTGFFKWKSSYLALSNPHLSTAIAFKPAQRWAVTKRAGRIRVQ